MHWITATHIKQQQDQRQEKTIQELPHGTYVFCNLQIDTLWGRNTFVSGCYLAGEMNWRNAVLVKYNNQGGGHPLNLGYLHGPWPTICYYRFGWSITAAELNFKCDIDEDIDERNNIRGRNRFVCPPRNKYWISSRITSTHPLLFIITATGFICTLPGIGFAFSWPSCLSRMNEYHQIGLQHTLIALGHIIINGRKYQSNQSWLKIEANSFYGF